MQPDGYINVKNFEKFQHYKDRNPPWIKLYNELLNDYEFFSLPDTAKAHLMLIWLLASQMDNCIPFDCKFIKDKIGAQSDLQLDILIDTGFIIVSKNQHKQKAPSWSSRHIPEKIRVEVLKRDDHGCVKCGARRNLEIDHMIPISQGGTGDINNLQVLCRSCNRKKRSKLGSVEQDARQSEDVCSSSAEPRDREETEAYKEEKSRDRYSEEFDLVWGMYPSRGDHSNPKLVAFKAWKVRLKEGISVAHLMAAVKRYGQECADNGKIGTEHVMQACTFFGPNERWKEYHEKDRKAKAAVPVPTEPLPDITPETREAQLEEIKKAKDELAARKKEGATDATTS